MVVVPRGISDMPALLIASALMLAPAAPAGCRAAEAAAEEARFAVDSAPARVGGEVRLWASAGQWAEIPVPFSCLKDWTISDPAVRLSPDRSSLLIAADATPGRTVEITARLGRRTLTTSLRISPATGPVLTGLWSQTAVDCGGATPAEPLRELRLDIDGAFAATFTPFESYKDYWGRFTHDDATGQVAFVVEGGNNRRPIERLEGHIVENPDDNVLILEGLYWGGLPQDPASGCRYTFRRR
jgi:hypothetical protein